MKQEIKNNEDVVFSDKSEIKEMEEYLMNTEGYVDINELL